MSLLLDSSHCSGPQRSDEIERCSIGHAAHLVGREEVGENVEERLGVEVLKVRRDVRTGLDSGQLGGMRHPSGVVDPSRTCSVPVEPLVTREFSREDA